MDMHIEIGALPYTDMSLPKSGDSSKTIRKRVNTARNIQKERFREHESCMTNSGMTSKMVEKYCKVDRSSMDLLEKSVERLGLSARAYHRILKIARTIADLDGAESLEKHHLAEAIQYRRIG
jgi:magnesium chelatase family protein